MTPGSYQDRKNKAWLFYFWHRNENEEMQLCVCVRPCVSPSSSHKHCPSENRNPKIIKMRRAVSLFPRVWPWERVVFSNLLLKACYKEKPFNSICWLGFVLHAWNISSRKSIYLHQRDRPDILFLSDFGRAAETSLWPHASRRSEIHLFMSYTTPAQIPHSGSCQN